MKEGRKLERLVGLGAGGHAAMLLEALQVLDSHEVVGLLDANKDLHGKTASGVPVLGGDDMLPGLYRDGVEAFFVGLGGTADNGPRRRLYEFGLSCGMKGVTIVHPSAIVSPATDIGDGAAIMPGAIVNAGTRMGVNVIVNSGAIVEHDCVLGSHVHVATGARLAGGVRIGEGAHIGVGASLRQGVTVGAGSVVGVGAAVVRDVGEGMVVGGVPAKVLTKQ